MSISRCLPLIMVNCQLQRTIEDLQRVLSNVVKHYSKTK